MERGQGYNNTFQEGVLGWFHNGLLTFPDAKLTHNPLNLLLNDHAVSLGCVHMEIHSPYFQLVIFNENSHPPPPPRLSILHRKKAALCRGKA